MANENRSTEKEEMLELLKATSVIKHFGSYSITIGILLMIIGIIGVILPQVMSLEAVVIIAVLFILGGAVWLVHAYKYGGIRWLDWLKPVLLLVSGGLMLFYPMSGIITIGLLLSVYLLLDALVSFILVYKMYPEKGWGWMGFNGITSLILATLFFIGWPETSLLLVGLYIAISLFFDGVTLIFIGWMQRHLVKTPDTPTT